MKNLVALLLLALVTATGCTTVESQNRVQEKCNAGDQSACAQLAQANLDRAAQVTRAPIPWPANAVGAINR
jgi:hypothetical protein